MKAGGAIVECSRTNNQELFSLVLGGYGLFGILLDVNFK
jgi:FAD/FMN-containing dehydrogenase